MKSTANVWNDVLVLDVWACYVCQNFCPTTYDGMKDKKFLLREALEVMQSIFLAFFRTQPSSCFPDVSNDEPKERFWKQSKTFLVFVDAFECFKCFSVQVFVLILCIDLHFNDIVLYSPTIVVDFLQIFRHHHSFLVHKHQVRQTIVRFLELENTFLRYISQIKGL